MAIFQVTSQYYDYIVKMHVCISLSLSIYVCYNIYIYIYILTCTHVEMDAGAFVVTLCGCCSTTWRATYTLHSYKYKVNMITCIHKYNIKFNTIQLTIL